MRCQPVEGRGRFPERGLHLIDIENLAGAAIPSFEQIRGVQGSYAGRLTFGVLDQVVVASSHLTLLNAALGWPHARYRVRSGPDGADLALLDVLSHEKVAARFTRVMIGSGDGAFARAVASLAAAGVQVTVVSRRDSLSSRLAVAAGEVVYLDTMAGRGEAPQAAAVASITAISCAADRWSGASRWARSVENRGF